jgi:hypothetical protein
MRTSARRADKKNNREKALMKAFVTVGRSIFLILIFVSGSGFGQSTVIDDLRRELPPEDTQPVVLKTSGTFEALQQVVEDPDVQRERVVVPVLAKIPYKKVDVGLISAVPGFKTDANGNPVPTLTEIGAEATVEFSGQIGLDFEAWGGNHLFDATVPMDVSVTLPAPETIAPGQKFDVRSSWRTTNDFSYNTSGPDDLDFLVSLHIDLDIRIQTEACFSECLVFDIPIPIGPIDIPLLNWRPCEEVGESAGEVEALGILVPLCEFVAALPDFNDLNEPFIDYPILNDTAPGVLQFTLLKEALSDIDLSFATSLRQGFNGGRGRRLTSERNWPILGLEVDLTNLLSFVSFELPSAAHIPPLNGDLAVLLGFYAPPGFVVSKTAESLGSFYKYNLLEALIAVDYSLKERHSFTARAPMIRITDGSGDVDWFFRAGSSRTVQMPDDLDSRSLSVEIMHRDALVEYDASWGLLPRAEFNAIGFSFGIPVTGPRFGIDPIYQTGNLFDGKSPLRVNGVDVGDALRDVMTTTQSGRRDVEIMPVNGGFAAMPEYTLQPTPNPLIINGRDLQQVDGDSTPRLVQGNEINFAIVDFTLQSGIEPVVVKAPGLGLLNTQTVGTSFADMMPTPANDSSGTFDLIGENEMQTYLAIAGDALQPGLDGITVNLAIHELSNWDGGGEVRGGLAFANNTGGYIRNSLIDLAPAADGTMLIADWETYETTRGPVSDGLPVKGRLEVYSGYTEEATEEYEIVELHVSNSFVNAHEFVLSTQAGESNLTTEQFVSPITVAIEHSIVHANIEMTGQDGKLTISGNSLFAGRDTRSSTVNGRVNVAGGTDPDTGEQFVSVLESGQFLNKGNGNTIAATDGGVIAILADHALQGSGTVDLFGSFSTADSATTLAAVSALDDDYDAAALYAALTTQPVGDATLLVDGGIVQDQIIDARGATLLALSGRLSRDFFRSESSQIVVDNDTTQSMHFDESQITGTGSLVVTSDSNLRLTAPDDVNGVVATLSAEGGSFSLSNSGTITVEGDSPVELAGDPSRRGQLYIQNNGDIHVGAGQELRLAGDVRMAQLGTIDIEPGGELRIVPRVHQVQDAAGNIVNRTVTPMFEQEDGAITVNGKLSYTGDSEFTIRNEIVNGEGVIEADVLNRGGVLAPDLLAIDGDYVQQSSGRMQINVSAAGNSHLDVTGNATIGGGLIIVLDRTWWGTSPMAIGDELTIMNAGGIAGEFDFVEVRLSDATLVDDFEFAVTYDETVVRLTLQEAVDPQELVEQSGIDLSPPEITPPANIDVEATGPQNVIDVGMAVVTDNVGVTSISNDAPDTFPVGITWVTWSAEDEFGNIGTATQTVTVVDTTPPVVTPPADIKTEATGQATVIEIGEATATDIVGVTSISSDAPDTFPVGITLVTWSAEDDSGNIGTATQTVTVVDTTPPVVTPPADISTEATGEANVIDIGVATATDIVGVTRISSDAPDTFPVGITLVTWSAGDDSGNIGTATQKVTVVDTTPPTIERVSATPAVLWPPNKQFQSVSITPDVSDIVDASPVCELSDIWVNQSAPGSKLAILYEITGPNSALLLADRDASAGDRIYTLLVTCSDFSGNVSSETTNVIVPRHGRTATNRTSRR